MRHTYETDGDAIYRQSFAIIRSEADLARFNPIEELAVVRMIHAAGMVGLEAYVRFSLVQPALFRLMFSREVDKRGNPQLKAAAIEAYASLARAAAREVPEAPSEGAVIAWSFVHGLSMLLLDEQILGVSPENTDSLVRSRPAAPSSYCVSQRTGPKRSCLPLAGQAGTTSRRTSRA